MNVRVLNSQGFSFKVTVLRSEFSIDRHSHAQSHYLVTSLPMSLIIH